jgi:tetratricopeptide (TPR) repeat protein
MMDKRALVLLAALAGAAHATVTTPASTLASQQAELRQYVHARLSDAAGLPDAAAASYARLMNADPADKRLAMRTYRQAMTAGNFGLAAQAAKTLDRQGSLPADATLLLLAEAVRDKDWARGRAVGDRIQREEVFAFLLPVIRGWLAVGAGTDPQRILAESAKVPLSGGYVRDHGILIGLLAGAKDGSRDRALGELRDLIAKNDGRALRLRLAAAALYAKRGDRATALSLLDGREPELVSARMTLQAGKILPGAVDSAAKGLSELLIQIAIDIKGDNQSPVSLQLARLATYLDPDNAAAVIATADQMAAADYRDAALALLATVPAENPLFEAARQERASILVAKGDTETALAEAIKATSRKDADAGDFVELGSIYAEAHKSSEAVKAYRRAIELDEADAKPNWSRFYLLGGALDQAGDWTAAKVALHKANDLDPRQAIVLNYLGYGMLEHGEDLAEAQAYIERASALDPGDAAISDSLGWLYYKRGNYPGAIAALERAIAASPGEAVMHEHLGDVYWATGRRIEARYAWRAALVGAEKTDLDRINHKLADGLASAK